MHRTHTFFAPLRSLQLSSSSFDKSWLLNILARFDKNYRRNPWTSQLLSKCFYEGRSVSSHLKKSTANIELSPAPSGKCRPVRKLGWRVCLTISTLSKSSSTRLVAIHPHQDGVTPEVLEHCEVGGTRKERFETQNLQTDTEKASKESIERLESGCGVTANFQ